MSLSDVENIRRNYEHLLVKLMAGVQKELSVNKQPWLNAELKLIHKSLEAKLQRKILHDVDNDLAKAVGNESPQTPGFGHGNAATQGTNGKTEPSVSPQQDRLRGIAKACLGLVKYLQFEGDLEMGSNRFHLQVMEAIRANFANSDEVLHLYSRNLVKIIQHERAQASKRQELPALAN